MDPTMNISKENIILRTPEVPKNYLSIACLLKFTHACLKVLFSWLLFFLFFFETV